MKSYVHEQLMEARRRTALRLAERRDLEHMSDEEWAERQPTGAAILWLFLACISGVAFVVATLLWLLP